MLKVWQGKMPAFGEGWRTMKEELWARTTSRSLSDFSFLGIKIVLGDVARVAPEQVAKCASPVANIATLERVKAKEEDFAGLAIRFFAETEPRLFIWGDAREEEGKRLNPVAVVKLERGWFRAEKVLSLKISPREKYRKIKPEPVKTIELVIEMEGGISQCWPIQRIVEKKLEGEKEQAQAEDDKSPPTH